MASQDKSGMVRWSAPYCHDTAWPDIIAGLLGACPEAVHAERYR
jgi:hypothetical protein